MALSGLFHRSNKHADERYTGTDVNHAEARDPSPDGPAVVGHDDHVARPHSANEGVRPLQDGGPRPAPAAAPQDTARLDRGAYDARDPRAAHDGRTQEHDVVDRHRHNEDGRRAALRDTYGGMNWGACFFGWLVAVGLTVLLGAIISAVASAVGASQDLTQTDLESMSGSVGLAAAITLAVVMFIGYFAGGYVAARMSRFDATRQGLGVWVVAIVVMIIAAVAGALFGSSFDIMEQVDLPNIGVSTDQLGWGALLAGVVLLAVMLVGAILGAATGRRYHAKIDRAVTDY